MPRKHHSGGKHFWLKKEKFIQKIAVRLGAIGCSTWSPAEIQRQVQVSVNMANLGFRDKEKRDSRQEQLCHPREYFISLFPHSSYVVSLITAWEMIPHKHLCTWSYSFAPANNSGKELALRAFSWTHFKSALTSTWSFWWPEIILMSYSLACYCLQNLVCLSNLDLTGCSYSVHWLATS